MINMIHQKFKITCVTYLSSEFNISKKKKKKKKTEKF